MDDARAYIGDPDPAWRAVGARSLVRDADADARARALLDPDPRVRRQAAHAAREAGDPADLDALADAARVDPEPIVRTEAVRAIAALSAVPYERAADVLRDLWTSSDEAIREDIAVAWARPGVWSSGGQEALGVVVAARHGHSAIEAAAAVLRRADAPADLATAARAQLIRAIEQGPRAERLHAIAQAPLERPGIREAIRAAGDDADVDVSTGALSRLAEAHDRHAVAALEGRAQPGSAAALPAQLALAAAGDRRVQAWLEQDLHAERPFDRLAAASALASLHLGAPPRSWQTPTPRSACAPRAPSWSPRACICEGALVKGRASH